MAKTLKANLLNTKIINVIRKFMIFDDLSPEGIKKLLVKDAEYERPVVKLSKYDAGEIVIKQGEFDCWSFWVVTGEYEVIQESNVVAAFTKPGQIFGEMSVLEGIPRTATVVSKTGGVCLCLDMSIIENMADDQIRETIKKGFNRVILARLNKAKGRMKREKKRIEMKYADVLNFENRIRGKA